MKPVSLKLTADESHQILRQTQIDNYYYHDSSQSHINFIDFVQFYCIEKEKPLYHTKMETLEWEHFVQCSFKQEHQLKKPMRFKYWSWAWLSNFGTTCCRIINSSSSSLFFSFVYVSSLQAIFSWSSSYWKKKINKINI